MSFWKLLFPFMLGLVLTWSSVGQVSVPVDREQAVRQRVYDRWQALIRKDWAAAYPFEAPAFRATSSLEQYQRKFGTSVIWEVATIDRVLFEGDEVATVYVNIQYQLARLVAGEIQRADSLVAEKWIRSDDQWWHAPESELTRQGM